MPRKMPAATRPRPYSSECRPCGRFVFVRFLTRDGMRGLRARLFFFRVATRDPSAFLDGLLRRGRGGRACGPLVGWGEPGPYGLGGFPERTIFVDELFDAKGSNVELVTVAVFV